MKYPVMLRPVWQGAFRRRGLVFEPSVPVECDRDEIEALRTDLGKALCIAKFDGKHRPKPDWDKTQRLADGEAVDEVFADLPPVVSEDSAEEPISLKESLIPAKYHAALERASLYNLDGIAAYLENGHELTDLEGIGPKANQEILEALEAHNEPAA